MRFFLRFFQLHYAAIKQLGLNKQQKSQPSFISTYCRDWSFMKMKRGQVYFVLSSHPPPRPYSIKPAIGHKKNWGPLTFCQFCECMRVEAHFSYSFIWKHSDQVTTLFFILAKFLHFFIYYPSATHRPEKRVFPRACYKLRNIYFFM